MTAKTSDPEELSKLFVETTDDLAYSRTYYPNRSVRVYLNDLSQSVYRSIYKNRKRRKGAFKEFWLQDIPNAMYFARKALLLSFLVFLLGTVIGIFSTMQDPEFPNIILSEDYVQMTEENIAQGNPMKVYQKDDASEMFFRIAYNNIRVCLLCFALGLLIQVGSLFFILYNSVMFGSFMWMFVQKGLMKDAVLTVMMHGTIELSMIIVAGAAGVALGKGLVRPESFSRLQAMIRSARHGTTIIVAVTAFLVVAAIIESFITRFSLTSDPSDQLMLDIFRGAFIILSLVVVLVYFVFLPYLRNSRGLVPKKMYQDNIIENPT
ncbi:MAG: stage II sporulation protein M, partial [Bacteroidota bacterium]